MIDIIMNMILTLEDQVLLQELSAWLAKTRKSLRLVQAQDPSQNT